MKAPNCKVCYVEVTNKYFMRPPHKNYNQPMDQIDMTEDYSIKKPKRTTVWKCPECGFRLTKKVIIKL